MLGFLLISLAILFISYISFLKSRPEEWYIWAAGAIVLFNSGLYFLGIAFIHKVKSDFSRKKKKEEKEVVE
jgi:hypothetical protein